MDNLGLINKQGQPTHSLFLPINRAEGTQAANDRQHIELMLRKLSALPDGRKAPATLRAYTDCHGENNVGSVSKPGSNRRLRRGRRATTRIGQNASASRAAGGECQCGFGTSNCCSLSRSFRDPPAKTGGYFTGLHCRYESKKPESDRQSQPTYLRRHGISRL